MKTPPATGPSIPTPATPAKPSSASATTTQPMAPTTTAWTGAAGVPTADSTTFETRADGTTSPAKVESPFSAEEKAVLSTKIPCPALAGLFNANMLKVEKDGTVKISDLESALSQIGPNAKLRNALTRGAENTDDVTGSFNLFKLNGSNLDHTGSSGIRQNGVHPERFDKLMSFSKDGERLTRKDLADAAEAFAKEDPGLRGRVTQQAEMTIVLEIFGRTANDGSRYLTREDAKQLFVDGQIPSSWSPPAVPGKVGLGDVLGSAALGLFRQLTNGR